MKTIMEYRANMLVILGDTAGRRYSEEQLDSALRQALDRLNHARPARCSYKVKVEAMEAREAILNWCPGPDADILTVRNESGGWLAAGSYRTGGKTYLTIYSGDLPAAGDWLTLEVSEPHTISGLDNAGSTSVPDSLMMTVCGGAAGFAMRIRARSVTEVFGKRPEDTDHLMAESEVLINEYMADLGRPAGPIQDPLPRGGFEI